MEFKTKDVIAAIVGDLWGGASTATAQLSRIAVLQTGILVTLLMLIVIGGLAWLLPRCARAPRRVAVTAVAQPQEGGNIESVVMRALTRLVEGAFPDRARFAG